MFAVNEGSIKNVILKNSNIKGRYNVGGICSWSFGMLKNNINYGQVSSAYETGWNTRYEAIGGIVGWADNTVNKCENYGSVISTTSELKKVYLSIGGIVGLGSYGNISECYNSGNIVSNGINAGGIIGGALNEQVKKDVIISKCYNDGDIAAGWGGGGISGWGNYMQIKDCYNKGTVRGNQGAGGITGWTGPNGSIVVCYRRC